MIPSPLAAGIYTAVKVAGYAAFAYGLNRYGGRSVPPFKFAAAKTALGLAGGVTYLFVIAPAAQIAESSDLALWIGAIPIRLLVWSIVLAYFYGFRQQPLLISLAALAGVSWSYCLDGVMSFFYRWLPGMDMPLC